MARERATEVRSINRFPISVVLFVKRVAGRQCKVQSAVKTLLLGIGPPRLLRALTADVNGDLESLFLPADLAYGTYELRAKKLIDKVEFGGKMSV